MISRLSANVSGNSRARPASVAQTRKWIVKSSYLLRHISGGGGGGGHRMREAENANASRMYTHEVVGVYVAIVCTRERHHE